MKPDTPSPDAADTDPTRRFERELRNLIADSFARGAALERTWEIPSSVTGAPNWSVRIEKIYGDDDPSYEPQLLDE
ncbi:hypothetical protein [Natronorubrum sp. FCH18a]|uniref:hypothetical protein n=1 Tax=Natronorubrum sp. FCH18a TaxID=3447018 RepID=UPI003F50F25E